MPETHFFNRKTKMRAIFQVLFLMLLCSPFLSAEEKGEVHIYIFKPDSSAYQGIKVESGSVSAVTDTSGFAMLNLPEGKQVVKFYIEGKMVTEMNMNIIPFEITETILTLGEKKKQLKMDIISEEEEKKKVAAEDLEVGDKSGFMSGNVIDSKSGKPIGNARVFVRGVNAEANTDENGQFKIELPVGNYAISIIHSEYTSMTLENLVIVEDKTLQVSAELLPSAVELEGITVVDVKVTGGVSALVEEKRTSQKLVEIIGAEQMSKSGDSDAASALKRVSGITVVDGKFIYVRGMGERYSNTLIDGLGLPSPIIERRVVPLDLFPADIIESLVVQKSSTADMPGEFGGGLVQIRTKGIPEEKSLKLGLSSTYNSESTFKDGLTHQGGDYDFLGFDDGSRDLPNGFGGLDSDTITESAADQIRPYWTPENTKNYPKGAGSLSYGDKFGDKDKIEFGVYTSLAYSNSTKNKEIEFSRYTGSIGSLNFNRAYNRFETTNNVELGGMLVLGMNIAKQHEIQFNSLLLRTTDKRSSKDTGNLFSSDASEEGERYGISWLEQEVMNFALHGNHEFNEDKTHLRWDVSTSEATRDQPDYRFYELIEDSGNLLLRDRDTDAFFSPNKLTDEVTDIAVDIDHTFDLNENKLKVETGVASTSKERDYKVRNFGIKPGADTEAYPLDLFFIEEVDSTTNNLIVDNINNSANVLSINQNNHSRSFYSAEQDTTAMFLMFDYAHGNLYDLNLGVRYEKNKISIQGENIGAPVTGEVEDSNVLPSINFKFKGLKKHQFRFGYSQTVNRPSFNEISRISLQTFKGEPFYSGFEGIQQAEISHYDFRWEFFFDEGRATDLVAISPFYKTIDSPIISAEVSSPDTLRYTYGNLESATLQGVEVDYRQSLSFLKDAWSDYFWSLNLTLVDSEVDASTQNFSTTSVSVRDGEQLTGQAPVVLNYSIGYDNPESGLNFALLYNYVAERVIALGKGTEPNTELTPSHQLDFVLGAKIKEKYSVKFKVQNILNDKHELTRDDKTVLEYDRGIDVSLGISLEL
jgi:hypothetical protein